MEVTIIIPIHNSEKYLEECIQSALLQTFQDLEILCIDGGSTDSSFAIIQDLQKKDNRIKYIYDTNTSYGHKINVGIKRAKGKYVAILESDDRMCSDMIEKLYYIAEKYSADIVDADYYQLFQYKQRETIFTIQKYPVQEIYNKLINCISIEEKNIANNGIWTALYQKEFLLRNNIYLNESKGASYQDTSFMFLTSFLASKVFHLDIPLYQYRVDNTGSSAKDNKKIFEIVGECEFLKSELLKRGIQEEKAWELYCIRKYSAFYWNYCRLSLNGRKMFIDKYLEELKKDINGGLINRDMFCDNSYASTFLLIDDKEKFENVVIENDKKIPLAKIYNIWEIIEGRGLVVFGAGTLGTKLINILLQSDKKLQGICDNSKQLQGTVRYGIEIISVEEAVRKFKNMLFLIANIRYGEDMKCQLIKEGIKEADIIVFR